MIEGYENKAQRNIPQEEVYEKFNVPKAAREEGYLMPPEGAKILKETLEAELEKPLQKLFLNKYERHEVICKGLNELYRRKNEAYKDSFAKGLKKYGFIIAVIRLEDKLNRLHALLLDGVEENDESIFDTLNDLANYAIMTRIELGG
jgi:hypothetical protein